MPHPQPPPVDHGSLEKVLLKAVLMLAGGFVASFTFFLRGRMGYRYLASGFLGGMAVQLLWATYYPSPELIGFTALWAVAALVQKSRSVAFVHAGGELHRDDGGFSAVMGRVPLLGRSVRVTKCILEPGSIGLAGCGLAEWSPGVATFFLWASVAMLFWANIEYHAFSEQVEAIKNDRIRARNLASHLRHRG